MEKLTVSFLIIGCFLVSVPSCHKNDREEPEIIIDIDSGKFLAVIDSFNWHPVLHNAIYLPKFNQLHISARDESSGGSSLWGGIDIDPLNPLKKYILEPNGNNAFRVNLVREFYSDINMADVGGEFTLTKLDTVTKKMSGILSFTGYNSSRIYKGRFATTIMEDLPLKIYTTDFYASNYYKSNVSCTVQGAATTSWQTKNIEAYISCSDGGLDKTLKISITSMMRAYCSRRELSFTVPLKIGKGKFQVFPDYPPYSWCGDPRIRSAYCSYNQDMDKYRCYAKTGEFNIIDLDTSQRKLTATFNVQYRDTTSKGETIQVSNGTINLNNWNNGINGPP